MVISSLLGKIAAPARSAYCASKHALHGFFDSLRAEEHRHGIAVTIICPGFVHTSASLNALTGEGNSHGKMDELIAGGLASDLCARRIASAIEHRRREVYIGQKEVLGVYLSRWAPESVSSFHSQYEAQITRHSIHGRNVQRHHRSNRAVGQPCGRAIVWTGRCACGLSFGVKATHVSAHAAGGGRYCRFTATCAGTPRALENAGTVYHCAAFVRDWGNMAGVLRRHRGADTQNVVTACRMAGAGRFVHVSSISVFGNPPESTGMITEDTPTGQYLWPGDYYGRSKMLAEEKVRELSGPCDHSAELDLWASRSGVAPARD